MIVRILSIEDAEAHHKLRLTGLLESPDSFGAAHEDEVGFTASQQQARILASDSNFTVGAFEGDGLLVGIATFRRQTGTKSRHKSNIYGMYVDPEYRGKGVGRAIIEFLLLEAKKFPGLEQIQLGINSTNEPARRLYSSFGFQSYGYEKNAAKYGGRYFDEEYMVLNLDC